jgi:AcrR family transcriptional regulator
VSRRDEIVQAAERILEAEGLDALTMRRLADELGIRAPSLYKHVSGKDDIEAALQARALAGMRDALAPVAGDVATLATAYRQWALTHPRLYELTSRRPLARADLPAGLESAAAQPLLLATGGDLARARALWGLAHGLVDLELAGRFPPDADLDAAWAAAVRAFSPRLPGCPGSAGGR